MPYLKKYFECFIDEKVELNKNRAEKLLGLAEQFQEYLEKHEYFKDLNPVVKVQGSWSTHTMIRPLKDIDAVDIDLLLCLDRCEEWEKDPKCYIHTLHKALGENGNFVKQLKYNTRCVSLYYADDCKVDIVPLVNKKDIINRIDNQFESSLPIEFTKWFNEKKTKESNIHRVAQLIKYIKSRKKSFDIPSITLSTLLGMFCKSTETKFLEKELLDTLKSINDYLSKFDSVPDIPNPVYEEENLARNWEQIHYSNFKYFLDGIIPKIEKAINNETDREESISIWKSIFGSDFPSSNSKCVADSEKSSFEKINTSNDAYKAKPYYRSKNVFF